MKTYLSGEGLRYVERFDFDWYFYHGEEEPIPGESHVEAFEKVQLPHDWSLYYPFDEYAPTCGSGGYVETGVGWYRKRFLLAKPPAADERIFLRFDGVYMLADVWVNGRKAGRHIYGYTPFEWDITRLLHGEEKENVIDVRVDNSAQPGSRWYSGSGITRDVWLYRVKDAHIQPYGVWIRQPDVDEKRAKLRIETKCALPYNTALPGEKEMAERMP